MKVLQVNSVYPLWSTGKITHDIHVVLQQEGHQSIVCYGRGENIYSPGIQKVCSEKLSRLNRAWARISGVMYGGHILSTRRLKQVIETEKPDVVHLQCINNSFINIYNTIQYLKEKQTKTVLTLHAEFMYTANCGHAYDCEKWKTGCGKCPRLKAETRTLFLDSTSYSWKRMKKAFEGFEKDLIVVSVSPWLKDRAIQSPILQHHRHIVVYNGLDTNVFTFHENDLRNKLGIAEDQKVVFHVTPNFTDAAHHIKGGRYIIELAKLMPEYIFIVAGPILGAMPEVPNNVKLLGGITDSNYLASLYSMADLTVLTSKKETFSMVCAESLCCGTPIVGFEAGAPEQISLPDYSQFVPYGNTLALAGAIKDFLARSIDKIEISHQAHQVYAKEIMAKKYIEIYKQLVQ
ncbi:MAG: glycosyltransferase [Paludibacteraceae bacterium]|nr:glycosyltransferase [Paludibacteraceae bacterium]